MGVELRVAKEGKREIKLLLTLIGVIRFHYG
jgi:hypothetical protein